MKSASKTKLLAKRKNGHAKPASRSTAVTIIRPLTAGSLKDVLWETLTDLKADNILPNRADAIAVQSREILRTIKTQMQISSQSKRALPRDIIEFSERR